jgi:hypothetical protein
MRLRVWQGFDVNKLTCRGFKTLDVTEKIEHCRDAVRTCMKLSLYEIALWLDTENLHRHGCRNRLKRHLLKSIEPYDINWILRSSTVNTGFSFMREGIVKGIRLLNLCLGQICLSKRITQKTIKPTLKLIWPVFPDDVACWIILADPSAFSLHDID